MRPLVPAAILGLSLLATALGASAQTPGPPDPPGLCKTWRTQWGDISAGSDVAPMGAFLGRVPPTCRRLRGRIERFIAARFPATPTPPPVTTTRSPPTTTTRPPATTTAPPPTTSTTWRAGQEFDDCSGAGWCPRMVVIPAGSFMMGSPDSETDRRDNERPQRRVSIRQFAVGEFEVTWDQWTACVNRNGCSAYTPGDQGYGRGNRPVINVSWESARDYVLWLSRETGRSYRLLTEAEWEYAARAGADTPYPWGYIASHDYANYGADTCCSGLASGRDQWVNTSPVGSFPANAFGLFDMHGNASEWVQDCYAESYSGLPTDGSASETSCSDRVIRGGGWISLPQFLGSASRVGSYPSDRDRSMGFRVARTLN